MAHGDQSTCFSELLQLLSEHGFDGMAEAIEILMNEAMKLERAEVLGARPHERTESRRGYANGFKPKRVNSRLGRLNLQVPQTRDVEFYPSALERGERSERALKLPLAEMYIQGVSTSEQYSTPLSVRMPAHACSDCWTSTSRRHRPWLPGSRKTWPKTSQFSPFRQRNAGVCGRRTGSSVCTRRLSAAPGWPRSIQTRPPVCSWSVRL